MHFYESSIITTKDGMHCQVYGNEHPVNSIIVKPKYIPTDKIESPAFQYRFISGKRMNRLNMWADKKALRKYMEDFRKAYPEYIMKTPSKDRLVFSVPIDKIERVYFPRRGFKELMGMPKENLDEHLKDVCELGEFLMKSGLKLKDLGVTYSTLMGHYFANISDINFVVYGKENYWKLMRFLEKAEHPLLRWKTEQDWLDFRKRRNRFNIFTESEFLKVMSKKKSEGFFRNCLFVIFCAEKEEERWFEWGKENYEDLGSAEVEATVKDNFSSAVRPGCYEVENCHAKGREGNVDVKKIVFYSRDYATLAGPGEKIKASGILERVIPKSGEPYHRLVVGYFDAYISDRREKEYIKLA